MQYFYYRKPDRVKQGLYTPINLATKKSKVEMTENVLYESAGRDDS